MKIVCHVLVNNDAQVVDLEEDAPLLQLQFFNEFKELNAASRIRVMQAATAVAEKELWEQTKRPSGNQPAAQQAKHLPQTTALAQVEELVTPLTKELLINEFTPLQVQYQSWRQLEVAVLFQVSHLDSLNGRKAALEQEFALNFASLLDRLTVHGVFVATLLRPSAMPLAVVGPAFREAYLFTGYTTKTPQEIAALPESLQYFLGEQMQVRRYNEPLADFQKRCSYF